MKKPRIILSLITIDNDFQLEQAAAAEEAAHRTGADIEVLFANGDSIEQSQQILKFVQAKPSDRPDGIIFEPVSGNALAIVGQAAVDAGIGWVVLNRQVGYVSGLRQRARVPIFVVTSDHQEMGRIQGYQLATLLPNGGSVLSIQGPAESDACKLRIVGLAETKPANIQVKTMRGNWTQTSAFKTMKSWLQLSTSQHERIAAVAAQNDAMVFGAREALEELGHLRAPGDWYDVSFLGMDGVPTAGQSWVNTSVLAATIVAPPLAGNAVDLFVRALRTGEVVPETTSLTPYSFPPLPALKPNAEKHKAALVART